MECHMESLNISCDDFDSDGCNFSPNKRPINLSSMLDLKEELVIKHLNKLAAVDKSITELKSLTTSRSFHPEELCTVMNLLDIEQKNRNELLSQQQKFESYTEQCLNQLFDDPCGDLLHEFNLECKRFQHALPIYGKKDEILDCIERNQVTIITAETGSGKSTQIVQFILQRFHDGKIVCTQPRKVAAVSLAKRVAEEMETEVGKTVGYCAGIQRKQTNATSILYVTDHLLLNECLEDLNLNMYRYIIVDEAHERSIATDLLLAMIKKALVQRPELRLVISSATIDPKVFTDYFKEKATRLHVHGRTFPVQEIYEKVSIGNDYFQASIQKVKDIHESEDKGDILVFLTTPAETERAQQIIKADKTLEKTLHCLVLHGRLLSEEQQLVFEMPPFGQRKVVFATNSAETSITIPNIRYVIDSGMVKEKHYDKERNISLLRVGPVNKSSAEQRKGRAGRTMDGKCFRLFTEEEYKNLSDEMLPEILRENLGLALLKLYEFGIENPMLYDFVQPPSQESLLLAQEELLFLGALDGNTLTRHGEIMATLGIEPKLAKFVALAIDGDVAYDAMVIASICSMGSSVFFRSGTEDEKQSADLLKVKFCREQGDLITMLEVFKEWLNIEENRKTSWCVNNMLNAKTLRHSREMIREMTKSVEKLLFTQIHTTFREIPFIEEKIPQLLFICFRKNVAHFSGHTRGGYFRQDYGNERYHLHPSSTLSYLSITPKWVIFIEVLCTSRTYLINSAVLPDKIAEELVGDICVPIITPVKRWTIGRGTAKKLGIGWWNSHEEQRLQELISENIYIEYDDNLGVAQLSTEGNDAQKAIDELDDAIKSEKRNFDRKIEEEPLSNGNPTSVLLGKGGRCLEMLEDGEFNSILLFNVKEHISKKDIFESFQTFGIISEVIDFKNKKNNLWGKIVYQSKISADSALKIGVRNLYGQLGNISIKAALRAANRQEQNQYHTISARWTRREATGNYAFISFKNQEHFGEFVGQSKAVGNRTYTFKQSKKNPTELQVTKIDPYISKEEIQLSIENYYPGVKLAKCHVPRKSKVKESPERLDEIKRQLSLRIGNEIEQTIATKRNFFVTIIAPNPDDIDFQAKIHFKYLKDAKSVEKSIIQLGSPTLRLSPDASISPITLQKDIYMIIKNFLERSMKLLSVRLQVKDVKSKNRKRIPTNLVELWVEDKNNKLLSDSEHLLKVQTTFYEIVRGERVKLSDEQYQFFLTPKGKYFINVLQEEQRCYVKVDKRIRAVLLYGSREVRQNLQHKINEKRELQQRERHSWTFDLTTMPHGFVKFFLQRYGVRLTQLYEETNASFIFINFLHHRIEFFGGADCLKKAKEILKQLKSCFESPSKKTTNGIECPVCFNTLELSSYQLETCTHSYCKECIQAMCQHNVKSKTLPLKCAKEGCDADISIEDIFQFVDIEELIPVAVEMYVAQNKDGYRYCITPDCKNVYKQSTLPNSEPHHCAVCQKLICTYCHKEYHDNIPCTIKTMHIDKELKVWLSGDIDRGLCPQCGIPIERSDECLYITCTSCKAHICWRCKTVFFKTGEECYDHLSRCEAII